MPLQNRYAEAALRGAKRESEAREKAAKADPIPFGMERVATQTWRNRFDAGSKAERRQMREALATREDPTGAMATLKMMGMGKRGLLNPESNRGKLKPARET